MSDISRKKELLQIWKENISLSSEPMLLNKDIALLIQKINEAELLLEAGETAEAEFMEVVRLIPGVIANISNGTCGCMRNELLQNKEFRLKQAQSMAHLGNWEVDLKTRTSIWSEEACRIYGIPVSEGHLQNQETWKKHLHPDEMEEMLKWIEDFARHKQPTSRIHRIVRKDKTVRYVKSHSEFEFDSEGVPVKMYGIVQDMTEFILQDKAREFDKKNLNTLIDNTRDYLWSVDLNLKLITCNQSFKDAVFQKTGIRVDEGKSVLVEGVENSILVKYKLYYERVLNEGAFSIIDESVSTPHNWVELTFSPIKSEGKIVGIACHSHDITKQITEKREIENLNVQLIQRNNELREFAQMVSHQLRAPLVNILGCSSILHDNDFHTEEEQKVLLDGIRNSALKLDEIVLKMNKILSESYLMNKEK